jgi:hypothetical protein
MFEQYNASEKTDDLDLQNQVKKGANWFYWIAGASLVNTIIILFNGTLSLVVGLGIIQIVSGIAVAIEHQTGMATSAKAGAFLLNAAISSVFVALGYFAGKGMVWAFIVGIAFYFFDGLIFLLFGDILSIGFHCFALFFIVRGFLAAKNLKKLRQTIDNQQSPSI